MIKWKEWTPEDRQMQRLVWIFVRYAMWDGLTWVAKKPTLDIFDEPDEAWYALEQMPSTIPMPTTPQYYVFVGMNKILISLGRDLSVDDVVKMEVAKVVNLTPTWTMQDACIISLDHVVIVNVDKTSSQVIVNHTPPLKFDQDSGGIEALIATFSPLELHPAQLLPNNSIFPFEIVENIFKFLVLAGGRTAIANFAGACKLFSRIVRYGTVKIDGCLVLTFPTVCPGLFHGLDENGSVELFTLEYLGVYELVKGEKNLKVLADGVNLGLSEKDLNYVKECALTDPRVSRK